MNKELYQYVFILLALGEKLTPRQRLHLECLNAIMADEAENANYDAHATIRK